MTHILTPLFQSWVKFSSVCQPESGRFFCNLEFNRTQSGTRIFCRIWAFVLEERRSDQDCFDFITMSTTSDTILLTWSFSVSPPNTKLFPKTQEMDSWCFSHTSLREEITLLHFLRICRYFVVEPKSGVFVVSSIEIEVQLVDGEQ